MPLPQGARRAPAMQIGSLKSPVVHQMENVALLPVAGVAGTTFVITWQTACSTPPAEAVTALAYAAGIWGSQISSPLPVKVSACWTASLPCNGIACGDTADYLRNFDGAPLVDTYYPAALADALAGVDLVPAGTDVELWFDSGESWSFVTSGAPGAGVDFVSVALHELAHGLGFAGNMYESYNIGFCGNGPYSWYLCPTVYDRFVVDSLGVPLLDYLNSSPPTLGTRLKSDASFGGPNTRTQNGAAARLNTPAIFEQGVSLSHLAPGAFSYPDTLMFPVYQSDVRSLGPVILAMMQDMGWPLAGSGANLTTSGPPAVGVSAQADFAAGFVYPGHSGLAPDYNWTVTDQAAITHTAGSLIDTVTLHWDTPGLKTLTVTATGGASASATRSVLVLSLAASGPTQGETHTSYTFQAALSPNTSALPVTYRWQVSGHSDVIHSGLGASDLLAVSWNSAGSQTVTVIASIGAASAQAVHTIQVSGVTQVDVFLPLIVQTP